MHVLTNAEKLIPLRDAASLAESRRLAGMRMVTGTTSPSTRYERISVSPASCSIKSEYVIASHAFKPQYKCINYTPAWEQRKLGELSSEFQSGDFISAEKILASGPYPVYGGNGLRGYAKRYNHDGFYALIGRQGALCGNVNTAVGKAYFTEHAVAIKANSLHDTRFLVHLLRCMDLGQYSGQSAQPGLAVGVLKEVETTVPSKVEQQAIGSFFSRLDDLITLHQRKRQWLKWLDEGGEGTHHDIDILVFKFADDMKISVLCGVHACMTKSLGHTGNRYAGKQQQ